MAVCGNMGMEGSMATGGIVSRAAPGASLKLVPSIEGGTSGWCISEIVRSTAGDTSFSCGEPPISTGAIFAENCGGSASRSVLRVFVIAASYVPAVEIDGPPISTHANRSLPDGLRTAVVEIRSTSGEPVPGWRGGPCPRATPVDARGKPIVRSERPGPALEVQLPSAQSWKAHKEAGEACAPAPQCEDLPTQPPSGPCQLRLTEDLPFSAASGNVLTRLEIPRRVFAHALLSCVDVAYKQDTEDSQRFEGAPLTAAVLLDAAHPGSPPPSLPEMEPLAGDHRVFIAPSWSGTLVARRIPHAWLVVEEPLSLFGLTRHRAPSTLTRQLSLLQALQATIELKRPGKRSTP